MRRDMLRGGPAQALGARGPLQALANRHPIIAALLAVVRSSRCGAHKASMTALVAQARCSPSNVLRWGGRLLGRAAARGGGAVFK
jgi:hypothetical protein